MTALAPQLGLLEHESPLAVRLAELASLSVRVDAGLLRRLRQQLLPEADVETESDLWFSPIVESRGRSGFQILPEVLDELRDRLALDRAGLEAARAVTDDAHRRASPAIRLEEALTGIVLQRATGWEQAVEDALRPALATLSAGGPDALDIARWALRAGPRLHDLVRRSPSGRMLCLAAPLVLGARPTVPVPPTASLAFDQLAGMVPTPAGGTPERVGVVFVAVGLQFREATPDLPTIEVPPTHPRLVGLEWNDYQGVTRRSTAEAKPGVLVPLSGSPRRVRVTTLAGELYEVGIDTEGQGRPFAAVEALPPTTLLNAVTPLWIIGRDTPTGLAFAVDREIYLTSREATAVGPILLSRDGKPEFEFVSTDLGPDAVALRRIGSPAPATLTLSSTPTAPVERAAVPAFEPNEPRWISIELDAAAPSAHRQAVIAMPSSDLLERNGRLVGAPVVVGDQVIGLIRSVARLAAAGDDPMLVLEIVPAATLQDVLARARSALSARTQAADSMPIVTVTIAGAAEGKLDFDIRTGTQHTFAHVDVAERRIVDALLEEWQPLSTGVPVRHMSELLIPPALRAALTRAEDVNLVLDEITARYPWELLQQSDTADAYGLQFGMTRSYASSRARVETAPAAGRRALVIGDTAPKLVSLPAAAREAELVRELLQRSGWSVEILIRPTPRAAIDALLKDVWTLVHIAGHGVQESPTGRAPISGVALDDGVYLTGREFALMRTPPQFIFLNASNVGRLPRSDAALVDTATAGGRSVLLSLVGGGSRAVIAPAWEPIDAEAEIFATELYRALVENQPLTFAIRQARQAVRLSAPQSVSWAAYHCYGEAMFSFSSLPVERAAASPPPRNDAPRPVRTSTKKRVAKRAAKSAKSANKKKK